MKRRLTGIYPQCHVFKKMIEKIDTNSIMESREFHDISGEISDSSKIRRFELNPELK